MDDNNSCIGDGDISLPVKRREEDRAYKTSLGFIALKPRSRRETAEHLSRKGFSDDAIAGSLARLERYGYLNDEAYARMLVETRTRLNPRGISALRRELALKGVNESGAAGAIQEVDECDAARRAVRKGLYRWRDSDRVGFTRKVMGFLGRRGFPYDISARVCAEAWESLSGSPESDDSGGGRS